MCIPPSNSSRRQPGSHITHKGLFRFKRVPYGLASAPSAFQKMMAIILEGLQNVANYLYYIIVLRRTLQEHDQVLKNVQQRLKDAGLLLNESKCQFKKQSLKFLGLIVTAQGDCTVGSGTSLRNTRCTCTTGHCSVAFTTGTPFMV